MSNACEEARKKNTHDDELRLFPGRQAHCVAALPVFVFLHGTLPTAGSPDRSGAASWWVRPSTSARPP
eukprot:8986135-Pyramimonas_sp.AAC.1